MFPSAVSQNRPAVGLSRRSRSFLVHRLLPSSFLVSTMVGRRNNPPSQGLKFFGMVGAVMAGLKLKEHLDECEYCHYVVSGRSSFVFLQTDAYRTKRTVSDQSLCTVRLTRKEWLLSTQKFLQQGRPERRPIAACAAACGARSSCGPRTNMLISSQFSQMRSLLEGIWHCLLAPCRLERNQARHLDGYCQYYFDLPRTQT